MGSIRSKALSRLTQDSETVAQQACLRVYEQLETSPQVYSRQRRAGAPGQLGEPWKRERGAGRPRKSGAQKLGSTSLTCLPLLPCSWGAWGLRTHDKWHRPEQQTGRVRALSM